MHTELKGKVLHRFKGEGAWCVPRITRRINILSDVNISDINREYIFFSFGAAALRGP